MAFSGKWKLEKDEHFDDYLKEIGVGMIARKMAGSIKPTQDIVMDNTGIKITTHTPKGDKTREAKFGEEKEEEIEATGDKAKAVATLEGDKIVTVVTPVKDGKKSQKVTRYMDGDHMVLMMECNGVTCKRFFKRA